MDRGGIHNRYFHMFNGQTAGEAWWQGTDLVVYVSIYKNRKKKKEKTLLFSVPELLF